MNIEDILKKDLSEMYKGMTAFEKISILLKLEELKLLTPEPKVSTDWATPHLKSVIREQERKIAYLTQVLRDNKIIVVDC